ncbi:MAG: GGDEF domain-containing protein [Spirochaetales bacterium]|nr:GGDEF domain-containing protein [Spirochaetales bacterium]
MFSSIQNKLFRNFSLATALVFYSFGSAYLMRGRYLLGGFESFLGILLTVNYILHRKGNSSHWSYRILVSAVYMMSLVIFLTGGIADSGFIWVLFIPLITMLMLNPREALIWAGTYSCLIVLMILCHLFIRPILIYDSNQSIQSLIVYLIFVYLTGNNESLKNAAREKLQDQNRELKRLSMTDVLTGLANRSRLNQSIQGEFNRFERYGTPFSLIMLDVDHFKNINDTWGHGVGDEVLVALSLAMRKYTRKSDVVGRWGGEEFLILCPETDGESAGQLAEKLRVSFEKLEFEQGFTVTASFGVSSIGPKVTVNSFLSEVDRLMYLSKEKGRNRVTIADK